MIESKNNDAKMIPVGYMFKRVVPRPEWLEVEHVVDLYSVAGCATEFFADYIPFWRHNGYWFFNSLAELESVAREHAIDLTGMTLFYYEAHEFEFDVADANPESGKWETFSPTLDWLTDVQIPETKILMGFDVVEYVCRNAPEDSLASCCNEIAAACPLNSHCLFDSFEDAKRSLESGIFNEHEPGPYRILAVYVVPH